MFNRRNLFGINRKSWNVAILYGLFTLVEGILWYLMPVYFDSKLNSLFLVGILLSLHPVASLIGDFPAGKLCDSMGRKFVFVLGVVGFAASFTFLFVGTFPALLVFMLLYGFFATMYDTGAFISIMDHANRNSVGKSAGLFTSINYAGWFFGSLLAGLLLIVLEVPLLLKVMAGFLMVMSLFSFVAFPGKTRFGFKELTAAKKTVMRSGVFKKDVKAVLRFGKPLLVSLSFFFAFGFWEYAIWTFEPIYTQSLGASFLMGAAILSLISLPGVVSPLIAGKLNDRLGERKMLLIGSLLIVVGQSMFFIQHGLLALAVSLIVTSSGAMFMLVPIECYVKNSVKWNMRGHIDGAWAMSYDVGGLLGPVTAGAIFVLSNAANPFYITFPLFMISITLMLLVHKK